MVRSSTHTDTHIYIYISPFASNPWLHAYNGWMPGCCCVWMQVRQMMAFGQLLGLLPERCNEEARRWCMHLHGNSHIWDPFPNGKIENQNKKSRIFGYRSIDSAYTSSINPLVRPDSNSVKKNRSQHLTHHQHHRLRQHHCRWVSRSSSSYFDPCG